MTNPIPSLEALFQAGGPFGKLAKEVCTLLRTEFSHYSWVGIYMIEEPETLILKAWDGPQATEHVRIPVGQGICGRAAREEKSVLVNDVQEEGEYLQCFLNTRSEIVVPIFLEGKVVGEIDIDGDKVGAYNETDRIFLEWCAGKLGHAYGRGKRPGWIGMYDPEAETLVDRKIREAEEKGMFDNLPTHGKRLNLQENPFAEKEWQLAFKVLKDNGVAPEFVERRKEIEKIRAGMKELLEGAIRGQKHLYRDLLARLETAIKALNSSLVRENHFIQGSFQLPQIDIEAEMAEFEKALS